MTVALIDGDILVYKAGFAVEKRIYTLYVNDIEVKFDEKVTKTVIKKYLKSHGIAREGVRVTSRCELEPESHAIQITKTIIKRILEETKAESYKIFITANDKSNFRYKIATIQSYKGNRKAPKPFYYDKIRSYLTSSWGAIEVRGQEADDQLGIENTLLSSQGIHSIICSIDKDLLMIPGTHYNIDTSNIIEVN
jgi:5'-3' exonuclease